MHQSVLLEEVLTYLDPQPGDVILDATLGSGGHAKAIIECIAEKGFFIGMDRDAEALERAERTIGLHDNVCVVQANFRDLDKVLEQTSVHRLDGILFDLGVSSEQLESPERGFSFLKEGPLDMRMDQTIGQTASELVNDLSQSELTSLFYRFGGEPRAKLVAAKIVVRRQKQPLRTTGELAEVIKSCYRGHFFRIHPATRVFQALRIAVNRELECLETGLRKAIQSVVPGGRIVVISFQSLEDRIVKRVFMEGKIERKVKILTKKVVRPVEDEITRNPRSRSAKLRAVEKAGEGYEANI